MKSIYLLLLSATLIAGCGPMNYMPDSQDKIALITVDCINEPSVKESVRQLLKLERVSDWTYNKNADGATQQIEARYTEITDMMAAEIKRRLIMTGGVLNVDIVRDRIPPKNPRL